MILPSSGRRCARVTGLALLALAALAAGCARSPDEAWLQFLGFKQSGKTISVFTDNLSGGATATVDADFENRSFYVKQNGGTGILVYRARIDYQMDGFSPPAAEYALNLYIASPATTTTTTTTATTTTTSTTATGTLSGFPLAPASLKSWLIGHAAGAAVVELTARVTFFAETDQGDKIETHGSIGIALAR